MEALQLAYRDLRHMLEERARTDPERVFIWYYEDKLSFREFNGRVNQLANAFKRLGVRKGDIVHVYMNNRPEMLVATMAAIKLGATAGPVNAWWQGEEIRYVFNDSNAVGVVTESSFAPLVKSLRSQCPSLRFVIELSDKPEADHLSYAGLLKESSDTLDAVPLSGSDDSFLFYTSGTTGDPKGAVLSHVGVLYCLEGIRRCVDITGATENPIGLIFLPLFHVNAMMSMMSVIYRNMGAVLRLSFSATEFGEVVRRFKPSFFSAVPTIYRILVQIKDQLKNYDLSSLKYGLCGAAPMTPELFREFEKTFGILIIEGYGLTEGTIASTLNPRTGVRKIGSIGKAMPGQEVMLGYVDFTDAKGRRNRVSQLRLPVVTGMLRTVTGRKD
jgi:long-chain acyl-CoA synthetase